MKTSLRLVITLSLLLFSLELSARPAHAAPGPDPQGGVHTLRLLGCAQGAVGRAFMAENPDVQLVDLGIALIDGQALVRELASQDAGADIFAVNAEYGLNALKEKGFVTDLSASAVISREVESFYPRIQDVLRHADEIIGVPESFIPSPWVINGALWSELELGAYPASYDDYLSLQAEWRADDDAVERYRLMTSSIGGADTRSGMMRAMIQLYILQNEEQAEPLRFDGGAFAQAARRIRELPETRLTESSDRFFERPWAIWSDDFSPADVQAACDLLTPPLIDGRGTPAVPAQMMVLVVNPFSAEREAAVRYLEYVVEHLEPGEVMMLSPTQNGPFLNPDWDRQAAYYREQVDFFRGELDGLEGADARDAQEAIALYESYLEREEGKYLIQPDVVRRYREIAPYVRLNDRSDFLSHGQSGILKMLYEIADRYLAGKLDEDAMVLEMNRRAQMLYAEKGL